MPVYNGAAFVSRAIESVLGQTVSDLELIVVDDGSTDDTRAVVTEITDARLRYIHQQNRGPSVARNNGIRAASAEWIAFLDSDDYWLPTKLEAQLARANEVPDAGVIYCGAKYLDPSGNFIADLHAVVEGAIVPKLLLDNCISGGTSSAALKRDVFAAIGLFDESMSCCEDWDLWLRAANATRVAKVVEPLVCVVNRPGSLNKRARDVRNVSIHMLEQAFKTYAAPYAHLRKRALWNVYRSAAVTYREHGEYLKAVKNIVQAISYRPHFLPTYWSLFRIATSPLLARKRPMAAVPNQ
jgi:glycosyltransferase involved in cell wall biosynthesis